MSKLTNMLDFFNKNKKKEEDGDLGFLFPDESENTSSSPASKPSPPANKSNDNNKSQNITSNDKTQTTQKNDNSLANKKYNCPIIK